jgi:hypothetical protein
MSLNEKDSKVFATIVLEILGRPKEHLIETLKDIIKQLNEEKGVVVKGEKINEPRAIEDQQGFYTTFAEVDLETEDIQKLIFLTFKYMPSHIEIVSPETIKMISNDWGETLSEITRRLHAYDEVARIIQNERIILEEKIRELMEEKKKELPSKKKNAK